MSASIDSIHGLTYRLHQSGLYHSLISRPSDLQLTEQRFK